MIKFLSPLRDSFSFIVGSDRRFGSVSASCGERNYLNVFLSSRSEHVLHLNNQNDFKRENFLKIFVIETFYC